MHSLKNYEVYRSNDGTVSKYIHEDGSETSIKISKSVQSVLNPITKQIDEFHSERNKYSIFISSSVGCHLKCSFCHLTLKKAKYDKLTEEQIFNIKDALDEYITFNTDIKAKYVKLSWMGMGDACNKSDIVYNVTLKILDYIFENNYAIGLDGVDLSTVMPKMKNKDWISNFHKLENELKKYTINPFYKMDNVEYTNNEYSHKNIFRLFYSIGSPIQELRDNIIPHSTTLSEAVELLNEYQLNGEYSVILHHVLVDGLNDTQDELLSLVNFVNTNFKNNELRLLRYNTCSMPNAYKESTTIYNQIKYLSDNINLIKVQVSCGSEVQSACGQFIVREFIRLKK